ncbi:hypothetical protein D8674_002069 [Pyrus ussuriensis x Pyrus communis]|uniref:Uncharacterized protein n=1 Tax=Pyrus ussuriensis x Pyrus communis TaxID=2448454 RepID=A0A5N5FS20_9ROSA|nr:hypothetical protein D8674_002069 [Pyrus ussuriensis x Pyrus communis]
MGWKQNDREAPHRSSLVRLLVGLVSCALVYAFVSVLLKPSDASSFAKLKSFALVEGGRVGVDGLLRYCVGTKRR